MSHLKKLPIKEFGADLILSLDLDPVYVALYLTNLSTPQLKRWLMAYMMFYNVGSACWLSEHEGSDFWAQCTLAGINKEPPPNALCERWPRSAERRHFRGDKCVQAITVMAGRWLDAEDAITELEGCRTDVAVMSRVKQWPMFGPWAAFKLADLLETCLGYDIQFNPDIGLLYEEPAAALNILETQTTKPAKKIYGDLLDWVTQYQAPPQFRRACGPQELETVLCKWKSYLGGHYHIGKDTHEIRKALIGWGRTAEMMHHRVPVEKV